MSNSPSRNKLMHVDCYKGRKCATVNLQLMILCVCRNCKKKLNCTLYSVKIKYSVKSQKSDSESRHLAKKSCTIFTAVAENHGFRDFRDFVNFYCPYAVLYAITHQSNVSLDASSGHLRMIQQKMKCKIVIVKLHSLLLIAMPAGGRMDLYSKRGRSVKGSAE